MEYCYHIWSVVPQMSWNYQKKPDTTTITTQRPRGLVSDELFSTRQHSFFYIDVHSSQVSGATLGTEKEAEGAYVWKLTFNAWLNRLKLLWSRKIHLRNGISREWRSFEQCAKDIPNKGIGMIHVCVRGTVRLRHED